MAHELTVRENGHVEMAYTGNIPWHGLGNELRPGASIETWIKAAGMDYRLLRARVRYATSHGNALDPSTYREFGEEFGGRVVLFRNDNGNPLGDVSDGYKVVQPREILEFFRDLTDAAGFTLETAGTLFGGRKMWALASIGADAAIAEKSDRVKGHLLLATACDGSMATEGRYVLTRVVCNNTLSMARGEGAPKVKINHRSTFKPEDVKRDLGIERVLSTFEATIENMRRLAETRLTNEQTVELTASLFRPEFDTLNLEKQQKILRSKAVDEVGRLALDGSAMGADFVGSRGTAWGWLNAVTQWVDHAGRARTDDTRINSAWFGQGDELKTTAYETVLAIANGARPIAGVFDANGKIAL